MKVKKIWIPSKNSRNWFFGLFCIFLSMFHEWSIDKKGQKRHFEILSIHKLYYPYFWKLRRSRFPLKIAEIDSLGHSESFWSMFHEWSIDKKGQKKHFENTDNTCFTSLFESKSRRSRLPLKIAEIDSSGHSARSIYLLVVLSWSIFFAIHSKNSRNRFFGSF